MRNLLRCALLLFTIAALVAGCSDTNTEAPTQVHPTLTVWYQQHRTATTKTTYVADCGGCHVVKSGPSPAVPPSCFSSSFKGLSCHADGPGGAPHPLTDAFLNGGHGKLAKADLTFCQKCHSDNPNGGPGSNPRFDVGISEGPDGGGGCEQCHPAYAAHPVPWAGPNDGNAYHYSAGNVQKACTLCHGVALDGVNGAGGTAVSCLDCHAEATNFTLDCTKCHGFPPTATTDESGVVAEGGQVVDHTKLLSVLDDHDQCALCHGVKNGGSGSIGILDPSGNYRPFDKTTDTLGDHWNGKINMNGDTQYNSSNFGCDFACHANDATHELPNSSNLPLSLGNYGSTSIGSMPPHPVGDVWLFKSNHATAAVNGSLDCSTCHAIASGGTYDPACQACHQVAPIMDPAVALTNSGCASCHSYPPDGTTPVSASPNRAGKHGEHFPALTSSCSSCHEGAGSDTVTHSDQSRTNPPVNPATVTIDSTYNAKSGTAQYDSGAQACSSVSCHGGQTTPNWYTGSLPNPDTATSANDYCWSCHSYGTTEYNSYNSGRHDLHVNQQNLLCTYCHNTSVLQNGVNGSGPTHWSDLATSAFELDPAATVGGTGTRVTSFDGTTCVNVCHDQEQW